VFPSGDLLDEWEEGRRFPVDGRRADEHVLRDPAAEELDVGLDVLGHVCEPVDDDVELLASQRVGDGRAVTNVGANAPHFVREQHVALTAVEHREVDPLLGEQARRRGRDVAGTAYEEDAHRSPILGCRVRRRARRRTPVARHVSRP